MQSWQSVKGRSRKLIRCLTEPYGVSFQFTFRQYASLKLSKLRTESKEQDTEMMGKLQINPVSSMVNIKAFHWNTIQLLGKLLNYFGKLMNWNIQLQNITMDGVLPLGAPVLWRTPPPDERSPHDLGSNPPMSQPPQQHIVPVIVQF